MRANAWMVLAVTTMLPVLGGCTDHGEPERITAAPAFSAAASGGLDAELRSQLANLGFTGRIGARSRRGSAAASITSSPTSAACCGSIRSGGLNDDNTCAGCHSPTNGFGDTQSIAIGIDNNGVVGPGRTGPRNQRRTPMVINTAFYPTLMWNSRFHAPLRRPVRQRRRLRLSRTRKGCHCRTCRTCSPRRRSSRRPSASRSAGFALSGRQRRHPERGPAASERDRELPPAVRARVPAREGRRADHVRPLRPRDRRVRVHAGVRRRADRPVRARRSPTR